MSGGRPAYKEEEVEAFKKDVCRAALELISEKGTDALSFRALARLLDSSHTRVHRYLPNKEAVLAAVRDYAYGLFADALGEGVDGNDDPTKRLRIAGQNYFQFAHSDPQAFHVLFNNVDPGSHIRSENQLRAWAAIRGPIAESVEQGYLVGDADVLTHVFWAAIHGIVTLSLTGNVKEEVDINDVLNATFDGLRRGHGAHRD